MIKAGGSKVGRWTRPFSSLPIITFLSLPIITVSTSINKIISQFIAKLIQLVYYHFFKKIINILINQLAFETF